jgi:hypothetical protein
MTEVYTWLTALATTIDQLTALATTIDNNLVAFSWFFKNGNK